MHLARFAAVRLNAARVALAFVLGSSQLSAAAEQSDQSAPDSATEVGLKNGGFESEEAEQLGRFKGRAYRTAPGWQATVGE